MRTQLEQRDVWRLGRLSLRNRRDTTPWEPSYVGDVESSWQKKYRTVGHNSLAYTSDVAHYEIDFIRYDQCASWADRWNWIRIIGPIKIVHNVKPSRGTREYGVEIFGVSLSILIESSDFK